MTVETACCKTCKGCGHVVPSPFARECEPPVAWVSQLLASSILHAPLGPLPWSSSSILTGLTKPVPCPDCDGRKTGSWANSQILGIDYSAAKEGVEIWLA